MLPAWFKGMASIDHHSQRPQIRITGAEGAVHLETARDCMLHPSPDDTDTGS